MRSADSSAAQRAPRRARIALTALAVLAASTLASSALAVPVGGDLLYGWGANQLGQVNAFDAANPLLTPVRAIDTSNGIIQVASSVAGSIALHADGTVWAWGYYIILGDGSSATRTTPGQVPGLPPIVQIATGFNHVLALGADGTLWGWGQNAFGELGVPSGGLTPVKVPLTGVAQITAGYHFSVALKANGEVWSWGNNGDWELGQGPATYDVLYDSTPRRTTAPYGIKQISAGHYHVLALRNDGSVWAWGSGSNGALGNGSFTTSNVAVRVDRRVSGITQIATGLRSSMAIGLDGSVWNWGTNLEGELGDGTLVSKSVPVKVPLQAPATIIAGGHQTSLAYLADGTLWSWGALIGTSSDPNYFRTAPVQIAGVTGVAQLAIDDSTLLALMAPQPVTVPDLSYTDVASATVFLEAAGLSLGTVTPVAVLCNFGDEIIMQNPLPGAIVPFGSAVSVSYVDSSVCF